MSENFEPRHRRQNRRARGSWRECIVPSESNHRELGSGDETSTVPEAYHELLNELGVSITQAADDPPANRLQDALAIARMTDRSAPDWSNSHVAEDVAHLTENAPTAMHIFFGTLQQTIEAEGIELSASLDNNSDASFNTGVCSVVQMAIDAYKARFPHGLSRPDLEDAILAQRMILNDVCLTDLTYQTKGSRIAIGFYIMNESRGITSRLVWITAESKDSGASFLIDVFRNNE